jgi:hypothetical protein
MTTIVTAASTHLTMLAVEAGMPAGNVVGTFTAGLFAAEEGLGVVRVGGGCDGVDDAARAGAGLAKLLRLWLPLPPPEDCCDVFLLLLLLLGFDGGAGKTYYHHENLTLDSMQNHYKNSAG